MRVCILLLLIVASVHAVQVRVKDIVRLKGVRSNQLVGYGLVVGLEGTGDSAKTFFTVSSIANMLQRLGIVVDKEKMKVENVAAVIVTAELNTFSRCGDRLDVVVSSIGDCESLEGGVLLQTPLYAADGKVYAVAQGPVSIGGFNVRGARGQRSHPTVARIVDGAIVEKEALSGILDKDGRLSLLLRAPDFTTASRIADAINAVFAGVAEAVDASCIKVLVPEEERKNIIGFVAKIEAINVVPDSAAKVVINERTATIVMGENLRVDEVVVTHKNLTLMVREDEKIRKERTFLMKEGVTLKDVVDALNAIGASPQDIIAIIQAIKEAGALHAQIILM